MLPTPPTVATLPVADGTDAAPAGRMRGHLSGSNVTIRYLRSGEDAVVLAVKDA